jgi:putative flippase GtrA
MAQFTVTGISNQDANNAITYTVLSQAVTITKFAAISAGTSITLTFSYVLPPTTAGTSGVYASSIITYADSKNIVD